MVCDCYGKAGLGRVSGVIRGCGGAGALPDDLCSLSV
jgi:hypothetical protein